MHIPAYGVHMVYAALEGAAVGIEYGLTDDEIIRGIAAYQPVGSRANVVRTARYTVIDDCYNANPDSTAAALRSATGLIRSTVGKQLGMKFTPTIQFALDAVPESAAEIEALLAKARQSDADVAAQAAQASHAGEADPYRKRENEEGDAG